VIAACHRPESYGAFLGSASELRARLVSAARAGASFVDVDWRAVGLVGDLGATRRIVSRHEGRDRPLEARRWRAELAALAREGDVVKLVHEAPHAEAALELLCELRASRGELVAFSSGAAGRFSRLFAALAGSRWTYAAPPQGVGPATAPGQWPADALQRELARIGSRTPRFFGVVGRPIAHSLSPALHGALFSAADQPAVYAAFEAEDFARFARAARAFGLRGLSITAPFKLEALALADDVAACARSLGAANTWLATDRGFLAKNTDLAGVHALLARGEALLGRPLEGRSLVVLGAGGAARAVVAAARERGLVVTVAARNPERAAPWVDEAGAELARLDVLATRHCDVLCNATPVGWNAGEIPVPAAWIRAELVLDAVYGARESELLRTARERGLPTLNGETWFLAQAAEQARAFLGVEPDRQALLRAFREATRSSQTHA
jgi:3-dehydroquinate dehydratase/shikimate dehydrogenase